MIQALTPEAMYWVLGHLRPADELELKATVWQGDLMTTIKRMSALPMASYEARLDETKEPVVIGGLVPIWPGLATGWLFGTKEWPKVGREVTRFIVKEVLAELAKEGRCRIECRPMCGNDEVVRWLDLIGFELEAKTPSFGRNGEDFWLYSWRAHGRSATH